MADERASLRKPAVAERRATVAARINPVAATAPPKSVARAFRQRLGNRGTQAFAAQVVARAAAPGIASASAVGAGQLSISQPGDAQEREADSVADKVMRMAEPLSTLPVKGGSRGGVVQRRCTEREEDAKGAKIRRKEGSAETPQITPSLSAGINTLRGGGSALPASTRASFEPRFGADFSKVRVHTGSVAASTASAINARAFTVGRDIVFNAGQYAPHSREGQHLLAHELTHVVQQTGAQGDAGGGTVMRAPFPPFMRGAPPSGPVPPKKPDPSAAARGPWRS